MKLTKHKFALVVLMCIAIILFLLELVFGTVNIPLNRVFQILMGNEVEDESWKTIVIESRLPRAITSLVGSASLALSGLLMQTLFRNPLAGPSVLGISSGSSLGVALLLLGAGSSAIISPWSVSIVAILGALLVLALVIFVSTRIADNTSLLIFGMMLAYITGAIVSVLQYKSSLESLRSFVLWSMGSFGEASWMSIIMLIAATCIGIVLTAIILPGLNLLLLGDDYAMGAGLQVKKTRYIMILATGLLAGSVTAFCGPVAFIGLAVPHVARMIFKTSDHTLIVPVSLLIGASAGLFCDLVSRIAGIPLNAVTASLGAPLVIYIVLRGSQSRSLI